MTYGELSYRATKLYTKGKITLDKYMEMTKPLNREIEQEPILDQIRAEIEQEYNRLSATRADETLELGECLGLKMSLKIIDKYNKGSEEENGSSK